MRRLWWALAAIAAAVAACVAWSQWDTASTSAAYQLAPLRGAAAPGVEGPAAAAPAPSATAEAQAVGLPTTAPPAALRPEAAEPRPEPEAAAAAEEAAAPAAAGAPQPVAAAAPPSAAAAAEVAEAGGGSPGDPGVASPDLRRSDAAQAAAGPPLPAANGVDSASAYGFYQHVFENPAAVIDQFRKLKKFFPGSPVYIMSDGGLDFGELCSKEGCTFELCPPANDRWHHYPFLRRLYDAALVLNTEYVIYLEPDNTVHGPITHPPTHDAGGIDVPGRNLGEIAYVEERASKIKPGFKLTKIAMNTGLAGGSYFRRAAILDAFNDDSVAQVDWNYLAIHRSKNIFSSDFAMPYALALRGWEMHPWPEVAQYEFDKNKPVTGASDAAFRHYNRGFPGGKPAYNLRLQEADKSLVRPMLPKHRQENSVCQMCYTLADYKENWGSDRCTNRYEFNLSEVLIKRHFKDGKRPRLR